MKMTEWPKTRDRYKKVILTDVTLYLTLKSALIRVLSRERRLREQLNL